MSEAAPESTPAIEPESLRVLDENAGRLLYDRLLDEARALFEQRREAVTDALSGRARLEIRQKTLRENYRRILGELPEPTPLEPQVVGEIVQPGYRIEKVLYHSRPGHPVTASLYLPADVSKPQPGVLFLCGHSYNGRLYDEYQKAAALFALNGFVTLSIDPICQGERFQFIKPDGSPATRGGTLSHTLLDVGAILTGTKVVAYELWDNIRGLDYLLSRPEVDPEPGVGCTGTSGGGTQTTFLMAHDERIAVAAPSCYLCSHESNLERDSAPDGCQMLHAETRHSIEEVDYITMRAPKPTCVLAAERDFFQIDATRELHAEARRVYEVLGRPERVELFVSDTEHGFTQPHREAAVRWMRRWFHDDDSPVSEPGDLAPLPESELWVSTKGQIHANLPDAPTVTDLNLERGRALAPRRASVARGKTPEELLQAIASLIGLEGEAASSIQPAPEAPVPKRLSNGCTLTTFVLAARDGFPLPTAVVVPPGDATHHPVTLVIDGRGNRHALIDDAEGPAATDLAAGRMVVAVEVRGTGETLDTSVGRNRDKTWNRDHNPFYLAFQTTGRPLLGMRTGDILDAIEFAASRDATAPSDIRLVALEVAALPGLHAAAFDKRVASTTLFGAPRSWLDVVAHPLIHQQLGNAVQGALMHYDLPDLVRLAAPRPIRFEAPLPEAPPERS